MPKLKDKRIYEVLAVFLLILAAAVIRNAYLLQYEVRLPYYRMPIIDSAYYDAWAMRVAEGRGYGPMPFYMAPLYPYVLAPIYMVFGHNFTIVYFFQELLGVLNVFLVYLLGRRLFGHAAGLIAGLLITLYAPVVYLESKLLTETLAIALSLGSLLMLMRAMDKPTIVRFLATGIMLGVSAVCRPAALLTAVLMVLWLLWRKPVGRRFVLVLAAGIALAILPVTARNYFIGRDFVLITSNGGIVFSQGNNGQATGISTPLAGFSSSIKTQQDEEMQKASKALGHRVTASESSGYWLRQGLTFAGRQPGKFARLLVRKLIWSLHNREAGDIYNVYYEKSLVPTLRFLFLPFSFFAGLGLFGFVRSRGKGAEAEVLALQVVSVFLALVIFSVSSRYRAPAVPVLAVFAGFGLIQAACVLRRSRLRGLASLAAWAAPVCLISFMRYPQPPIMADAPGNAGSAYFALGCPDKAITELRKSLAIFPESGMAHLMMANALEEQGKPDEAVVHYLRAQRVMPGDVRVHVGLANALSQQGKLDGAIMHYRRALQIAPRDADTHLALGYALSRQKRFGEAIREYRKAIRLNPGLALAHNNLAVALYFQGDYAQAWMEISLCRKYGFSPNPGFLRALASKTID